MNRRELIRAALASSACPLVHAEAAGGAPRQVRIGANRPWTTYLAQNMRTNGAILGHEYDPNRVETESSKQRCVRLTSSQDYVEFVAKAPANAMVVRFSLPDAPDGGGISSSLRLYRNGALVRNIAVTSKFAWLYGAYPFSNDPSHGRPRRFYDEVRLSGLAFHRGDVVRLQKADGAAAWCVIDLVDLEEVASPRAAPANSLSLMDFGAAGRGETDDTVAVKQCIAEAANRGMGVWAPPGTYRLTGEISLPPDLRFLGAGIWHTNFVGDPELYAQPDQRVRFVLSGRNIRVADFAIIGCLTYRNDTESNDGVIGVHASDCTITNIWVEHTKVGAWLYGCSNVVIENCRIRNTMADGVNLCTHTMDSVVRNCTTRNTGDDCFAIWPAAFDHSHNQTSPPPGRNVIHHCTGELPYLANGGAIYGGADNRIEDCQFTDISVGCGVLISSTFPTADKLRGIDYNFSGVTVVRNCLLERCGGFDHDWAWRGAFEICVDQRDISGVVVSRIHIHNSLSDGFSVVGPDGRLGPDVMKWRTAKSPPIAEPTPNLLSHARLDRVDIDGVGLGAPGRHGLWVHEDTRGSLSISHSRIANVANQSRGFSILYD